MARNPRKLNKESGISLILAILALLVTTSLAVAMMFAVQAEALTSQNYQRMMQSRYAAEAGAQWAANWLSVNYTQPSTGYTGYTTTTFPITYAGSAVVLSSSSSLAATNYSDATMASNFSTAAATASSNFATASGIAGAGFTVEAQLVTVTPEASSFGQAAGATSSLQRWKITARGTVGGTTGAGTEVTVGADNSGTPLFSDAIFATSTGCGAVNMSNNASTTSYNSATNANPSYSALRTSSLANASGSNSAGVGSNGNISVSGGSGHPSIAGSVSSGYAGTSTVTCSNGAPNGLNQDTSFGTTSGTANNAYSGTQTKSTRSYAAIPLPNAAPTTTCTASPACNSQYVSGTYTMAPGSYGNVSFGNGDTIQLQQGVYVLNSISVAGGVTVNMPTSGAVTIYIQGTGVSTPISFSNGTIANAGGIPGNLQIIYNGTGSVQLGGGTAQHALIYAPNAAITMNNANQVFGAVVGGTISFAGGGGVAYDTSLLSTYVSVSPQLKQESFSWNSF
jgi:hypothetical protein